MKNLLIYLNSSKNFDDEYSRYAKIQIENSLRYWKPQDILIATNFKYEYLGVHSIVVPSNLSCDFDPKASKVSTIIYLLENKIITSDTWFHDFDCFQNNPFELNLNQDLGLTDYGWKVKFNTGSFFFKPSSIDIFTLIWDWCQKKQANEEPVLWELYKHNINNISARCERLNITYNLGMRKHEISVPLAEKPIKVMHFHPYRHGGLYQRFKPLLDKNLYHLLLKYA